MKFEDIKVGMTVRDIDYEKCPVCTVVYVDDDGFLIKWIANDGTLDGGWRRRAAAEYFVEHVEPNVNLDTEYWVSKATGEIFRVRPWHYDTGWVKHHDRIRFTGFEILDG